LRDNPGIELGPTVDIRRRYKKYFPSVLSCIDKKTKKAVIVEAKLGKVYSRRGGEEPFSLKRPRKSSKREISSPGGVAGVP